MSEPDLSAEWTKDGSPVEETERIKPKSVDTTHTLNIASVTAEDAADYEVTIGDTSAKMTLSVEGKFMTMNSSAVLYL